MLDVQAHTSHVRYRAAAVHWRPSDWQWHGGRPSRRMARHPRDDALQQTRDLGGPSILQWECLFGEL